MIIRKPPALSEPDDLTYLRAMVAPYDRADLAPGSARRAADVAEGGRLRTRILVAATVVAVAAAIGMPLLIRSQARPTTEAAAVSTPPLSPQECRDHNLGVEPSVAPSTEGPVVSSDWYSPAKAGRLVTALRAGLPAGACVFTASSWGELTFPEHLALGVSGGLSGVGSSDAQAGGRVVTSTGDGTVMVSIRRTPDADTCLAGDFDSISTGSDGTRIWQLSSSSTGVDGRWIVLVVTAYRPDGTCLVLRSSDEVSGADQMPVRGGLYATGAPPLSIAQLTSLAKAPGLSVSG
ncbi:hypothetical protein D1871_06720 [Nakamurella silvestris]|nr:hypothetical protein D1871_06720 [Nakamurella silvestris]